MAEPPLPAPKAQRSAERWSFLSGQPWRRTSQLAFSYLRSRPEPARAGSAGYALSGGEAIALLPSRFVIGGLQEYELRFVPDDALSLSLSRYQLETGVRLGPLEPMVRVGFTTIHFDYGHGFSIGLFSPRVGAGLWLKLGRTRFGVSAFSEYSWRWFGDDSAFVHGLTFELQLDLPK